jgi:hypothetical protein
MVLAASFEETLRLQTWQDEYCQLWPEMQKPIARKGVCYGWGQNDTARQTRDKSFALKQAFTRFSGS